MFKQALDEVLLGKDLSEELAEGAVVALLKGEVDEIKQASFLTALKIKGETPQEVAAFARTMRKFAEPVNTHGMDVIDLAGTGGDGKATFNVSTSVAFVIGGLDVKVAKHGNHGVSGPVGSADVLGALGIPYNVEKEMVEDCLKENGVAFLYAPRFQPATGNVAKVRRTLGFRTIFNILGPLTNPASPTSQLMGIYDESMAATAANVLVELGAKRAMVVRSFDGMDEVSALTLTKVYENNQGEEKNYVINPLDYGFTGGDKNFANCVVKSAKESADLITQILSGEKGLARDMVAINAAAAIYVYGFAKDLAEGIKMANESIDSGAALAKLQQMQKWGKHINNIAS